MAIPKYFDFFGPILELLQNDQLIGGKELYSKLADNMGITSDDREVFLPSGKQLTYVNRINWALTYLRKAGLIKTPSRGQHIITPEGKNAFLHSGKAIDLHYLEKYEGFREFRLGNSEIQSELPFSTGISKAIEDTPEDAMESGFQKINIILADELLNAIMDRSPAFFERLVVQLLVKMGYGGTVEDAGRVIGRTNDEGIDGVIREDKLGFSSIYIQAKRWALDKTIGRPDVQTFVGALAGQGASKGLFITTAQFSNAAVQYAQKPGFGAKVVLVDGKMLAKLMIENDVGVSTQNTYIIKKVDTDFFLEEND